jgi:hypothetical protein
MPDQMPALHAIAQHYFNSGQPHTCYLFTSRLVQIKKPDYLERTNPQYNVIGVMPPALFCFVRDHSFLK